MPCVQIFTNQKVPQECARQIKAELGRAIECLPGKTEEWLMVSISDDCSMSFGGKDTSPAAFVEVKILGREVDQQASRRMTSQVCELLYQQLDVEPQHCYVRYTASPDWGWNGEHF